MLNQLFTILLIAYAALILVDFTTGLIKLWQKSKPNQISEPVETILNDSFANAPEPEPIAEPTAPAAPLKLETLETETKPPVKRRGRPKGSKTTRKTERKTA